CFNLSMLVHAIHELKIEPKVLDAADGRGCIVKAFDLTPEEQTHVRTALRSLRARCGGWEQVAKVLHFKGPTVRKLGSKNSTVSPTVAFGVARLVKVGVDDVLAGRFPPPGTCPHCGHCEAPPAAAEQSGR